MIKRYVVNVVKVEIDVDTDRDGIVHVDDDEEGEDDFTKDRGAVILANRDRDNGGNNADCDNNVVDGIDDQNELSKIVIRRTGFASLPSNFRVVLRIKNDQAERIRIFSRPLDGEEEILGPTEGDVVNATHKEHVLDPSWVTGSAPTWTLGAEALKYIGEEAGFDGKLNVWLVYQTTDNSGSWTDMSSDEVVLQVAPCVLAWNGQTAEKVYDSYPIHSEVDAALTIPVEKCNTDSIFETRHSWIQDFAELLSTQHSGGREMPVILDLDHSGDDEWPTELWNQDYMYGLTLQMNGGNGGDIEVTPPHQLPTYPLGRILTSNSGTELLAFFAEQKVQVAADGQPIMLYTTWMTVEHVDALVSFVPKDDGYAMLVPSPRVAIDIMHIIVSTGQVDATMHVGMAKGLDENEEKLVVELLIKNDGSEKTTLAEMVDVSSTHLEISLPRFAAGDFLRIDDEYLRVENVSGVDLTVTRGELESTVSTHDSGALIYALSDLMRENIYKYGGATGSGLPGPQKRIDVEVEKLRAELNPANPSAVIVEYLPVIYKRRDGLVSFDAYTPNMVNCLVAEGKAIMCDPEGPKVGPADYFKNYTMIRVGTHLQPVFIDAWKLHLGDGGVHCGSNARRTMLSTKWWEAWKN